MLSLLFCVCVCVCVCVCLSVCVQSFMHARAHACMYACPYTGLYACNHNIGGLTVTVFPKLRSMQPTATILMSSPQRKLPRHGLCPRLHVSICVYICVSLRMLVCARAQVVADEAANRASAARTRAERLSALVRPCAFEYSELRVHE